MFPNRNDRALSKGSALGGLNHIQYGHQTIFYSFNCRLLTMCYSFTCAVCTCCAEQDPMLLQRTVHHRQTEKTGGRKKNSRARSLWTIQVRSGSLRESQYAPGSSGRALEFWQVEDRTTEISRRSPGFGGRRIWV